MFEMENLNKYFQNFYFIYTICIEVCYNVCV